MATTQIDLPRRTLTPRFDESLCRTGSRKRVPAALRAETQSALRDMAFVLACTRRVADAIRAGSQCLAV